MILEINESYIPEEKFIWSERAVDISYKAPEKVINEIAPSQQFEIDRSYGRLKTMKLKNTVTNSNYEVEKNSFEITKSGKKDTNPNSSFITDYYNNIMTLTDPNKDRKKFYRRNKLIDFLPKISNTLGNTGNETSDISQTVNYSTTQINLNRELLQLDEEYQNMKKDLIELNPLLKNNNALREQFFINVSEGKEEKYTFIKNLYNIVNETGHYNKPVFHTNIISKKNNGKKNLPPSTKLKAKNKINMQYVGTGFSGIRLLTKSASGSNIISKKGLNFLEGVNIK